MSRSRSDDSHSLRTPDDSAKGRRGPSDLADERLDRSGDSSESGTGAVRSHSAEIRDTDPRRTEFRERGRTYRLRTSEIEAMTDIGKFRVIDVQELAAARYNDDEHRMRRDITNLVAQGLVEGQASHSKYSDRELVTLTKPGERLLRKTGAVSKDQETYHGFVKPRELDHDADLYRVYHRESAKIEEDGGRLARVVLDFELKRDVYRELSKLSNLPENERERGREEIAEKHGLTVVDGTIMLPDLRIEYETRDGEQARVDLELATAEYRTGRIAAKAGAGFSIYARSQDEGGVRKALQDSRLIQEIFSI